MDVRIDLLKEFRAICSVQVAENLGNVAFIGVCSPSRRRGALIALGSSRT